MTGLRPPSTARARSLLPTGACGDSVTRASFFSPTPWLVVGLLALLATGCTAPQPSPLLPPSELDTEAPTAEHPQDPSCARCASLQAGIAQLQRQLADAESELTVLRAQRLEQAKALERSARQAAHATARLKRVATPATAASYIAEVEVSIAVANSASNLAGNQPEVAVAQRILDASMELYARGDYEAAIDRADQAAEMVARASETSRSSHRWKRPVRHGWTPQALRVRIDSHLRRGPSRLADARGVLRAGTPVVGFARKGVWVRVATADGHSGWVYRPLLEPR